MTHHLNTNKQFMIGNGILAFGVIVVVVIFVYMSLREKRAQEGNRYYTELYAIKLERGFAGDSLQVLINDSVLANQVIRAEPFTLEVKRFDDQNALIIVDNLTNKVSLFDLDGKGEEVVLVKEEGEIVRL